MKQNYNDRILRWIDLNYLLTSSGERFEWHDHQYLIDPLCDWSPEQGINKSAQLGGSETLGVVKALYAAEEMKLNVIYTLPSDKFLQKFVPPKVDRIIQNNPVFKNIEGGISLKKIGSGLAQRFIYFIGTHNPEAASEQEQSSIGVSVTSDFNIHDEASRSDQFILNQLRTRLDNSKFKWRYLFDNPLYPNMGADAIFNQSDQMHWIITCSHCGYKQYLDWVRLDKQAFEPGTTHCWVDTEKKQFVCGKCLKEITDEDRRVGEWIPKYSNMTYRGYWMPQMIYVRHSVFSILKKEEDPTQPKSLFYNYVLGKPYIGSDVKLSSKELNANLDSTENDYQDCAMGVDQGNTKWYVVGNRRGIFLTGSTDSWDEIVKIFNRFKCKALVMDALPQQRYPKKIVENYPGRAWRAFYKPEADQTELAKFGTSSDSGIVLIKRDEMLDEIVDDFLDCNQPLQIDREQMQLYSKHWADLVRIVEPDNRGNQRFTWHAITGTDHLAHATLYFRTALLKTKGGHAVVMGVPKAKSDYSPTIINGKMANTVNKKTNGYQHF